MHEAISVGQLTITFLVDEADSNGSHTVFEVDVPAGARVPAPHSHDAFEETIYVLEGTVSWTVGGETFDRAPGEALCIKRGVVHGFENRGDAHVRFLAVAAPGVFGPAYFREVGAAIPDLERVGEVMRRHGLTPAA
jgi:quercetin dioxygenase-like cupin family protein